MPDIAVRSRSHFEAHVRAAVIPVEPEPHDSNAARCYYCALDLYPRVGGQSLTVDHLVPRSTGGSDDPGNLVPACKSCNSAKGTLSLDDWRSRCISNAHDGISRLVWLIGEDEVIRLRRLLAEIVPPERKKGP